MSIMATELKHSVGDGQAATQSFEIFIIGSDRKRMNGRPVHYYMWIRSVIWRIIRRNGIGEYRIVRNLGQDDFVKRNRQSILYWVLQQLISYENSSR